MKELTETERIINRHTARLLSELEEANCPTIYVQAVKSKLAWLRQDLNEVKGHERHERKDRYAENPQLA